MTAYRWIASAAALAALGACAVVPTERETKVFNLSGFDAIIAHSGIDVVLKQGPFSVSAETPKGRIDKIVITQNGTTLDIGRKEEVVMFNWGWNERYVVTVAAPNYTSISSSGGADVDIDPLKAETLNLTAHGGADVNLAGLTARKLSVTTSGGADVNAKALQLGDVTSTSSGGGDLRLAGTCKTITIEASSGADVSGTEMTCETATVTASSGADVEIAVNGGVATGKASGGGDINFHGNPSSIEKDESSGGDVRGPKTAHPAPA
jgi:Putative auto-transporter adhesin, head GIN domain